MSKKGLEMYKLQDIIEGILSGVAVKKIARTVKISKNTVKRYKEIVEQIIAEFPNRQPEIDIIMRHFREIRKTERLSDNFNWLDEKRPFLEELLKKCDNYARLIEVLNENGFKGSYSSLTRYIQKNNLNPEQPVMRIESKPGEIAQVDFGSIGNLYDETIGKLVKAYVFVMTLCYSRLSYYEIVRRQDISTWCQCHVHSFEYFDGVPAIIIPDNLKSAIIKASFTHPEANRSYADMALHYNFQIEPCLPSTPEHKGKVESQVKYVKNNFIPLRKLGNFEDANFQLHSWNEKISSCRIHGTTRQKPVELFNNCEKEKLRELPRDSFETPIWKYLKAYRDFHFQIANAYYSVPYALRGEYVWVRKTDSQVAAFHDNELVAVHLPASAGDRRTTPSHNPPDKYKYMRYDSDYCIALAEKIGQSALKIVERLLFDEPVRYLRAVQNIIRLKDKYGSERLEIACQRAIIYNNYSYQGIKKILEKELDKQPFLFEEPLPAKLDATYALDIKQLLLEEEINHGNIINS